MKFDVAVKRAETIYADAIRMVLPYDEDDGVPDGIPGADGELLTITVKLDTGRVVADWRATDKLDLTLKVRDLGAYYLLDEAGKVIASIEDNYVPSCVPGSYGDYVELDIGGDGIVKDWAKHCTQKSVAESFYRDFD